MANVVGLARALLIRFGPVTAQLHDKLIVFIETGNRGSGWCTSLLLANSGYLVFNLGFSFLEEPQDMQAFSFLF